MVDKDCVICENEIDEDETIVCLDCEIWMLNNTYNLGERRWTKNIYKT